jgi:DNA-binding NtrC family response regulator
MARILVVDDEVTVLDAVTTVLQEEGHDIVPVLGGEEAKGILVAQTFDLMISDIRMRPVDGMELLRQAREKCPDMSVVMLTAFGQVETAVEAMELGAFDYVAKPFTVDKLLSTVQKALRFRQFEQEGGPAPE